MTNVIPFPGTPVAPEPPVDEVLQRRLDLYREDLLAEGVDPATIRTHDQLDALLSQLDADIEAALERLPDHAPERQVLAALDQFLEDGDAEAARHALDVAGNRAQIKPVE